MPRILVAEGHAPTRDYVQRSLGDAGFEVLSANDAGTAFELFATRRPDAVVLGADFAEGDEYALVRRLRDADPRLLLVVADKGHLGRALGLPAVLQLGANAYVADPTRRDLVDRVSRLVSQAGAALPQKRPSRPAIPALPTEPDARGELVLGAVARLFHQLWQTRADGVLVLEEPDAERRFLFLRGAATGFWSRAPAESLLRWVCAEADVPGPARYVALEAMAGGLSPGAALVAAGIVEPGEALTALLCRHLTARIVRAVGAREGRWRFHAGAEVGGDFTPVELRAPLAPVLEGARLKIHANHQVEALRNVSDAFPVRSPAFQAIVAPAALSPTELRLALTLDGRLTTRAWLEARRAELRDGLSLLWFLSLAGAVIFPIDRRSTTPIPRGAESALPPLPSSKAEGLRQAALQILPASPYQALGLDVTAGTEDVERAYHALARRYHPDTYAGHDLGGLEDLLVAVQDRISGAYRALGSVDRRRAYLGVLVRRLEQQGLRRPGTDPLAEVALVRAERALRERRVGDAVEALRTAVALAPREPEYLSMLAFATLHDSAQPAADRAREAERLARKALSLQPDHPRATAAYALAAVRKGEVAGARRVLLSALKEHPDQLVLKELLHRLLLRAT